VSEERDAIHGGAGILTLRYSLCGGEGRSEKAPEN